MKIKFRRIKIMSNYFLLVFAFVFSFSLFSSLNDVSAQTVVTSPVTDRIATQQIIPYDRDQASVGGDFTVNVRNSFVQVSNTSSAAETWIHVQILRSFSLDPSLAASPIFLCLESDFVDLLTPRDTTVYNMAQVRRNITTPDDSGSATASGLPQDPQVDDAISDPGLTPPFGSKGYVFITPIVGETDRTAKAFQHLIGNGVTFDLNRGYAMRLNAGGRDAVDSGGAIVADNTILDGAAATLTTVLPAQFTFEIAAFDGAVAEIGIMSFDDTYGPGGFLGYEPVAGSSLLDPFIVGPDEDAISCAALPVGCYVDLGINLVEIPWANGLLTNNGQSLPPTLCTGENPINSSVAFYDNVGWAFTNVVTASQNVMSWYGVGDVGNQLGGAIWTRSD